jgi:4-amino-4-deoxy-L-arabinose transferase-like glycosyltransferase
MARGRTRTPVVLLVCVGLLGLAVRLWVVLVQRPTCDAIASAQDDCFRLGGDAYYFFAQSAALADGRWFVDPSQGGDVASAGDPPAFASLLAAFHLVGIDTVHGQRVALAFVGTAGVVLLALAAGRLAGVRAAWIAGILAALDPNLWINDGMVMGEALLVPLIALILLACTAFVERPTAGRAAALGAAIGLGALTRGEVIALVLFVAVPLVAARPSLAGARKVGLLGVCAVTCLLVLTPWFTFNAGRFQRMALMTSGTGSVLLHGSCEATFDGEALGYNDASCFLDSRDQWLEAAASGDESARDAAFQDVAVGFIGDNTGRLPVVAAARVGRAWGVYRTGDGVQLDGTIEGRGIGNSQAALAFHLVLFPLAVVGLIVLHRRRQPISPYLGIAASTVVTIALSMGVTRYRVPWDACAVVLGAVALDALWTTITGRSRAPTTGGRGALAPGARSTARGRRPSAATASTPPAGR